jgi:hypothetical protein
MSDSGANQILVSALNYWQEIRGDRFAPRRADINPSRLRNQLRHIQFIDVVEGGRRFCYRMVGTRLVELFGNEFAGKYVDDLFSGEKERFFTELYKEVCALRSPMFVDCVYRAFSGLQFTSNRLYLPLSEDGAEVTMIMGVLLFNSPYAFAGEWSQADVDLQSVKKEIVSIPPTN